MRFTEAKQAAIAYNRSVRQLPGYKEGKRALRWYLGYLFGVGGVATVFAVAIIVLTIPAAGEEAPWYFPLKQPGFYIALIPLLAWFTWLFVDDRSYKKALSE